MSTVEAKVTVSGSVQGVWFRASTQEAAAASGAVGYVRNLPDGRVEAVIQGKRDQVDRVIDFMKTGPPGASVSGIEIEWRDPHVTYGSFTIGY